MKSLIPCIVLIKKCVSIHRCIHHPMVSVLNSQLTYAIRVNVTVVRCHFPSDVRSLSLEEKGCRIDFDARSGARASFWVIEPICENNTQTRLRMRAWDAEGTEKHKYSSLILLYDLIAPEGYMNEFVRIAGNAGLVLNPLKEVRFESTFGLKDNRFAEHALCVSFHAYPELKTGLHSDGFTTFVPDDINNSELLGWISSLQNYTSHDLKILKPSFIPIRALYPFDELLDIVDFNTTDGKSSSVPSHIIVPKKAAQMEIVRDDEPDLEKSILKIKLNHSAIQTSSRVIHTSAFEDNGTDGSNKNSGCLQKPQSDKDANQLLEQADKRLEFLVYQIDTLCDNDLLGFEEVGTASSVMLSHNS